MSHVMSASAHRESKELSKEGFASAVAFYSLLLAVVFGGATALGYLWSHPTTWLAPAACLVMVLICMYAAGQEGKASSTFASVLGAAIFLGLAVGSTLALLNWGEVFGAFVTAMTLIAVISLLGVFIDGAFKGWGLVIAAGTVILIAIVVWEFMSQTSLFLGHQLVTPPPSSWIGIATYVGLAACVWHSTFEEEAILQDHDSAIRAAADALLNIVVIFSAVIDIGYLVRRQLSPKGDSND